MTSCPICSLHATLNLDSNSGTWAVVCQRCGRYSLPAGGQDMLRTSGLTPRQVACIAGWIREHQDSYIDSDRLTSLRELRPPPVGDKATKLLLALSKLHPNAGQIIRVFSCDLDMIPQYAQRPNVVALLPDFLYLVGSAWIESRVEFDYIVKDYLGDSRKLLMDIGDQQQGHKITPDGWAFLDDLQRGNPSSRVGFIAMWFRKELDPVLLAIESGIRDAGYDPKRIDRVEHNNRIDDEIIAWIRRSKFVVADMTGNRGGVYFESGYALGMGLQVIWLCDEKRLHRVHFDNRQYNFIEWSADRLPELTQRLQNRIEATIGRPT